MSFISNLQVKRVTEKGDFKRLAFTRLTPEQRAESHVLQWKLKKAPASSDIIWVNMQRDEFFSSVRSWFLIIILFIVCVIFLTPMTLVDQLTPLIEALTKELGQSNLFSIALQNFCTPLLVLAFNSGLLPLFIDFIAYLEGHKSKSAKQIGIMRKNFFF